jgi:hypothetical protein
VRPEPLIVAPSPHYSIDLARVDHPFGLGGEGVKLLSIDRLIDIAQVEIKTPNDEILTYSTSARSAEDGAGYFKQIRGERFEFVPATVVNLYGRDTLIAIYIDEADGKVGRVYQPLFRNEVILCAGLNVTYGDDLSKMVKAWAESVSNDVYRSCELVYNYSDNGNVLDSVASLANRVSITTSYNRAVAASVWR